MRADPLRRCVGDIDHFAEHIWGRQVQVREPGTEGFRDLLDLDDVDRLVAGHGLRTPALRLIRQGRPVPESQYTRSARIGDAPMNGLADADRVFAEIEQGATLVLQGLQRYWPPLTRFCRDLELALGHQCQVNAYVTPPGSQGFRPHADTHDVFVLQAFGGKTWQLWQEPTAEGEPTDAELVPGSTVYLPAGVRHAARAQHTLSGHLTVGIHPTRWRRLVETALTGLLDDPELETALPVAFHRDPEALTARLAEHLRQVGKRLETFDPADVADDFADRVFTGRATLLHGGLADRMRLGALDDGTRLRHRAGAVCEIREGEPQHLRVLLGDRELRVPARIAPAVHAIAATTAFTPADLAAHLDPDSRLVLVRRLVREGLLEVVDE